MRLSSFLIDIIYLYLGTGELRWHKSPTTWPLGSFFLSFFSIFLFLLILLFWILERLILLRFFSLLLFLPILFFILQRLRSFIKNRQKHVYVGIYDRGMHSWNDNLQPHDHLTPCCVYFLCKLKCMSGTIPQRNKTKTQKVEWMILERRSSCDIFQRNTITKKKNFLATLHICLSLFSSL